MSTATMTPGVAAAVADIEATFPDATLAVTVDEAGGAWVVIDPVDLGPAWEPPSTWLGFHLAPNYPYPDVYPHFIGPEPRLAADGTLPQAVSDGATCPAYEGTCLQVSRRSNRWDPTTDTAALKAIKVLHFLRVR